MAFSPRAVLRPVFATATLAVLAAEVAGPCAAQEDGAGSQGDYRGPLLSWTGKSPAPTPAPAPTVSSDAAATYVAPRRPAPAAPPAPERASPPPAVAEAAPAPYMAPPAPPAAAQRAPLAPAAPARMAAVPAAPDQSAAASAATPTQSPRVHVRFYSVDRAYGITPDPIAMPARRPMVLVGPPDASGGPTQTGDGAGDAGKPAPHDGDRGAGAAGDQTGDN